jgi:hypothetical protein
MRALNSNSAYLDGFVSPDDGASSPKRSICTVVFVLEFCLEDRRTAVELPKLELNPAPCFDKRNVRYGSLTFGIMVRRLSARVAHLVASLHQLGAIHALATAVAITVLHQHIRRNTMSHHRGHLRFESLFTAEELGLPEHANIAHVVKVFLAIADGVAARWIEMPKCALLLQTVAGNPESGAIYLYDRERRRFYLGVFEHGRDDDALTTTEFEDLVTEYDLLRYIENPRSLTALSPAGNA